MTEKRYAILIGNSGYPEDEKLSDLRCPEQDVDGLAEVLLDPRIGKFTSVKSLKNKAKDEIQRETLQLFKHAQKGDLALFYFSGHGKLDRIGSLYLAALDTQSDLLEATSVPLQDIKTYIDNYSSTRIVVILDCCFSGAADKTFTKGDVSGSLKQFSGGRGKYILTASTAIQTAQEKEEDRYSVFTKHIIEGLKTGDADLNGSGEVTIEELYQYVYARVRDESHQEPMNWGHSKKGELVIASNPKKAREIYMPSSIALKAQCYKIMQMLEKGEVIPFLGPGISVNGAGCTPPIFEDLARQMAHNTIFSGSTDPLTLISQKIDLFDGRRIVIKKIKEIHQPEPYPYIPTLTHRFLARIDHPLLIFSTCYDTLLEEAFDAAGKPYAVVTHILYSKNEANRGKVVLYYSDRKEAIEIQLSEDLVMDLNQGHVIYKIHGVFNLFDRMGKEIDFLVVSEEDYIRWLRILENPQTTIPNCFIRQIVNRLFLFLGYSLSDWNFRAVVDSIHRKVDFQSLRPYAVCKAAPEFEKKYWGEKSVNIIDKDLSDFIQEMAEAMGIEI